MNHTHESQAAAMDTAGELPDGEQLRECINSGQVSAAQVVAHAGAGELTPMVHQCCGREICDGADCPNKGPWYKVPKWRMSGYYYDFEVTGSAHIDRILSAVGCAGKCFHHTQDWLDDVGSNNYKHLRGNSPIEWIQNAAIDAAAALAAERAEVARLREALEGAYALAIGHATTYQLNHQLAEVHPTHQAILDKARAALTAPGEKHD